MKYHISHKRTLSLLLPAFLVAMVVAAVLHISLVQASSDDTEVKELNEEVSTKKAEIDQIRRKIDTYTKQIAEKQAVTASLSGEVELLDNRIAKNELAVQALQLEIEAVQAEVRLLDGEIASLETELIRQKTLLVELIRSIDEYDQVLPLKVVFGADSFSDVFDHLQYLENVHADLRDRLDEAKKSRELVIAGRTSKEGKRTRLVELEDGLTKERNQLAEERGAKDSLLVTTQESEAQYRSLLTELRQEQSYIDFQIGKIQTEIEQKLAAQDTQETPGTTFLSWPVDHTYRGISAYFHDPSYPYRHLFEHSGLDIPEPHGTAVGAAAPGYVAWAKSGPSYGNYIMIIHTNGIATLYAHLSQINVVADQFVARGEVIGKSGGTPGTPGAGLSTGAHLHFEVRKNGIPVNPLDYLVK